jgi:hypothetical protein
MKTLTKMGIDRAAKAMDRKIETRMREWDAKNPPTDDLPYKVAITIAVDDPQWRATLVRRVADSRYDGYNVTSSSLREDSPKVKAAYSKIAKAQQARRKRRDAECAALYSRRTHILDKAVIGGETPDDLLRAVINF